MAVITSVTPSLTDNSIATSLRVLRAKRPSASETAPHDPNMVAYSTDFSLVVDGITDTEAAEAWTLITSAEFDDLCSAKDRNSAFAAIARNAASLAKGELTTGPKAAGDVEESPPPPPVNDSYSTLCAALLLKKGLKAAHTQVLLGEIIKSQLSFNEASACLTALASYCKSLHNLNKDHTADFGVIDEVRAKTLSSLGDSTILQRLGERSDGSISVMGCHIAPVLVGAGFMSPDPADPLGSTYMLEDIAVKVDCHGNLVDPAHCVMVGEWLTTRTQRNYHVAYVDPQVFAVATNMAAMFAHKIVNGRHVVTATSDAGHQLGLLSLSNAQRLVADEAHLALQLSYADIATKLQVANPRYQIDSSPDNVAVAVFCRFLADRNAVPAEDFAKLFKMVEKCAKVFATVRGTWDNCEADLAALYGGGVPQTTRPDGTRFIEVAKVVMPAMMPTIANGIITEMNIDSLKKANIRAGPPIALTLSARVPAAPYKDMSPGGMRKILVDSRHIRNAEVDKFETGGAKARISATTDCATFLAGQPTSCVAQEYVNCLSEFSRHAAYDDFARQLANDPQAPIMKVYESSKYHPAGSAASVVFGVSSTVVNQAVHAYAKSNTATDHSAPITSRFGVPLSDIKKAGLNGVTVVVGSSWLDIQPTKGFNLDSVQEGVVNACIDGGATGLIMLCRLDREFNARPLQRTGTLRAGPSAILQSVFSNWREVSFVPGLRPHNGMFWMVATGRRDVAITVADKHMLLANQNWNVAYFYMAIQMYRANVLKNAATTCCFNGGPDASIAKHFSAVAGPYPTPPPSIRPGLSAWGLHVRNTAAMTKALAVETTDMADFYTPIEEVIGANDVE